MKFQEDSMQNILSRFHTAIRRARTLCLFMLLVWPAHGAMAFAGTDITPEELEKRYGGTLTASECYDKFSAKVYTGIGWIAEKGGSYSPEGLGRIVTTLGKFIRAYPNDWRCFCTTVRISGWVYIDGELWSVTGERLVCKLGKTANRYLLPDPKSCTRPEHGDPSLFYDVFGDGTQPECQ
jgi:hypothetical protein